MIRVLVILAGLVALLLAARMIGIGLGNFVERTEGTTEQQMASADARREAGALRILREAYPASVSSETLGTLCGGSPADIALALAGNPGVEWVAGVNGSRWYKLKSP
jgi:hypothetical protein